MSRTTKKRIIEDFHKELWKKGFDKLTLDDIADHYRSIEQRHQYPDLLLEVLNELRAWLKKKGKAKFFIEDIPKFVTENFREENYEIIDSDTKPVTS